MSIAKRKPRVLLSAGMIQGGLSGVGRYVIELAKRIYMDERIDLHVAGLDSDRHLFKAISDSNWLSIPAARANGVKNLLWHQMRLPSLLKEGSFDLLHTPSYRRIVALCPVPQIVTVHDCAPFRLRDKYGFLRGIFGRQVAPFLARRCESVLTVSEFTKKDLVTYFKLSADDVDVVYNGVDHRFYRPRSGEEVAAFREKQGIDAPFFLFISRLEHPGKNHIRLIEAYEKFRDQSGERVLLVFGGAPWHGAEVIAARVADSPYSDDIRTSGYIEEADLPYWYSSALALVFPSLMEGFGLPVVEALACGARVTSSDRGSLAEVGGDAAVYFDPEEVDDITRGLATIHGEPDSECEKRIIVGYDQAAGFDWEIAAKSTCQNYLKVLNT